MVARISTNLLDYANWFTFTPSINSLPKNNVTGIASYNGDIYALVSVHLNNAKQVNTDSSGLYKLTGSTWQKQASVKHDCHSLKASKSSLIASCSQLILTVVGSRVDSIVIGGGNIKEGVVDRNGIIWLADANRGLLSNRTNTFESYNPNSVFHGVPFKLVYSNDRLFNIFGGYFGSSGSFLSGKGMDVFYENQWSNYGYEKGNLVGLIDFVDIVHDPNTNHYFLATYGQGVIELDENFKRVADFNHTNSPL